MKKKEKLLLKFFFRFVTKYSKILKIDITWTKHFSNQSGIKKEIQK